VNNAVAVKVLDPFKDLGEQIPTFVLRKVTNCRSLVIHHIVKEFAISRQL
jgi:hypothetical protein